MNRTHFRYVRRSDVVVNPRDVPYFNFNIRWHDRYVLSQPFHIWQEVVDYAQQSVTKSTACVITIEFRILGGCKFRSLQAGLAKKSRSCLVTDRKVAASTCLQVLTHSREDWSQCPEDKDALRRLAVSVNSLKAQLKTCLFAKAYPFC